MERNKVEKFLLWCSKLRTVSTKEVRANFSYRYQYIKEHPGFNGGKYYFCAYCLKRIKKKEMQVDHIYPLNLFGPNRTYNTVSSCSDCNGEKSDRLMLGYLVKGFSYKILVDGVYFKLHKYFYTNKKP